MIFLGGSCNPTAWRKDIAIPLLEKAGLKYFNPQTDKWSREWEKEVEQPAKAQAAILLFVIDNQTRAIGSMVEAAGYLAIRPVVLAIQDIVDGTQIDEQKITGRELRDLNRGRAYLRSMAERYHVPEFCTVEEAVYAAIGEVHRYGLLK